MSSALNKTKLRSFLTELNEVLDKFGIKLNGEVEVFDKAVGDYVGFLEDEYSSLNIITEDGDTVVSVDKDL